MKKLTQIVEAKKKEALAVYIFFAIIQIALIVLYFLLFEQLQGFIVLAEIVLFAAFALIYRKFGLRGAFSKLKKGIILSKKVKTYTQRDNVTVAKVSGAYLNTTIGILEVYMGDTAEKLSLTQEQLNCYIEGDSVLWSRAFKYPILLDRTINQRLCPFCGTIQNDEKVTECFYCGQHILFAFEENELKARSDIYEDKISLAQA